MHAFLAGPCRPYFTFALVLAVIALFIDVLPQILEGLS